MGEHHGRIGVVGVGGVGGGDRKRSRPGWQPVSGKDLGRPLLDHGEVSGPGDIAGDRHLFGGVPRFGRSVDPGGDGGAIDVRRAGPTPVEGADLCELDVISVPSGSLVGSRDEAGMLTVWSVVLDPTSSATGMVVGVVGMTARDVVVDAEVVVEAAVARVVDELPCELPHADNTPTNMAAVAKRPTRRARIRLTFRTVRPERRTRPHSPRISAAQDGSSHRRERRPSPPSAEATTRGTARRRRPHVRSPPSV